MEEARRILLHTDRSVSDIAETVGYSNISNAKKNTLAVPRKG